MTPISPAKAPELGFKIVLDPKEGTGCSKPLDHRIQGAIKSQRSAKFDCMIAIEHNPRVTKEAAVKLAQECWKDLTRKKCS
jgi:hypothetical protein